jgi:hypothetical protein
MTIQLSNKELEARVERLIDTTIKKELTTITFALARMLNQPIHSMFTWDPKMIMTNREIQQRITSLSKNSAPLTVMVGWMDSALPDSTEVFANPENRSLVFEWVD